jgi:hypothetical protein
MPQTCKIQNSSDTDSGVLSHFTSAAKATATNSPHNQHKHANMHSIVGYNEDDWFARITTPIPLSACFSLFDSENSSLYISACIIVPTLQNIMHMAE